MSSTSRASTSTDRSGSAIPRWQALEPPVASRGCSEDSRISSSGSFSAFDVVKVSRRPKPPRRVRRTQSRDHRQTRGRSRARLDRRRVDRAGAEPHTRFVDDRQHVLGGCRSSLRCRRPRPPQLALAPTARAAVAAGVRATEGAGAGDPVCVRVGRTRRAGGSRRGGYRWQARSVPTRNPRTGQSCGSISRATSRSRSSTSTSVGPAIEKPPP